MQQPATTPTLTEKTPDERKALLAQSVANHVRAGWRIESQTDFQAVLVKGHRPNHVLHLLLTIFTFGMWGIVWLILVLTGGEKRQTITVDGYGQTLIQ